MSSTTRPKLRYRVETNEESEPKNKKRKMAVVMLNCNVPEDKFMDSDADWRPKIKDRAPVLLNEAYVDLVPNYFITEGIIRLAPMPQYAIETAAYERGYTMEELDGVTSAIDKLSYWTTSAFTGELVVLTTKSIFNIPYHEHVMRSFAITPPRIRTLESALFEHFWRTFNYGSHLKGFVQQRKPALLPVLFADWSLDKNNRAPCHTEDCHNCGIKRSIFREALIPWSTFLFHCAINADLCRRSFCSCNCELEYMATYFPSTCGYDHNTSFCSDFNNICDTEVPPIYCSNTEQWFEDNCNCHIIYNGHKHRKELQALYY
jgi:hypothetical protein